MNASLYPSLLNISECVSVPVTCQTQLSPLPALTRMRFQVNWADTKMWCGQSASQWLCPIGKPQAPPTLNPEHRRRPQSRHSSHHTAGNAVQPQQMAKCINNVLFVTRGQQVLLTTQAQRPASCFYLLNSSCTHLVTSQTCLGTKPVDTGRTYVNVYSTFHTHIQLKVLYKWNHNEADVRLKVIKRRYIKPRCSCENKLY